MIADGNVLNIALARLRGGDDRFLHEGDSQGEGHGYPFARPHAHGTTLPLEAGQFCRNLVVAFRKVGKGEVAGRAGVRRRSVTPRIVTRAPGSGAPVWSEIEPASSPAGCAGAEAGAQNSARTAAITTFILRIR